LKSAPNKRKTKIIDFAVQEGDRRALRSASGRFEAQVEREASSIQTNFEKD
jgi:hypothetical protein